MKNQSKAFLLFICCVSAMGVLCNPEHPALAHFPTEMHTNWQWWHLLKNSTFMNLASFRTAL